MRINIMDSSLIERGGHPHDIDLRTAQALVKSGHDVFIYCHANAATDLISDYQHVAPITPLFTIHPYSSNGKYDYIAGNILKNLDGGRITANELLTVRDADIWLWPSLYSHQLIACNMTNTKALISGCIHHPPDFFSPDDTQWWRYGFIQAMKKKLNLRIGCIEPETRYLYAPLTLNRDCELFPFPNDGYQSVTPRHAAKIVGIFGFQREEKGSNIIRQLSEKLLNDGFEVILHDSNSKHTQFDNIAGIKRLGHVMNLDAEIAKCDLVLTPYHPESYRYRGSGIVMSAIASGVPVIAPFGSAPGRLVEKTGAGTLFMHYSQNSIYSALQEAVNNYSAIAEFAHNASLMWPKHHGLQKFVDAMLNENPEYNPWP